MKAIEHLYCSLIVIVININLNFLFKCRVGKNFQPSGAREQSYWYGFKANQDVYNLTLNLERVYLYMGKMFCNYQEIFF